MDVGFNLVQQCRPKALFPLLVFIWLCNTPGSEEAGDNLCAGRPHAEMFRFNLPALLPGELLPFPSPPPPPVSTASIAFQTSFLSLFLVAVLPAVRQAVSLRHLPILLFLPPPLLGKIPSSVLNVNYFQTNARYTFILNLYNYLCTLMIYVFSPWTYLYSFILATIYCSFVLSSCVECYVWGNCLSCPSSCFIFLYSENMIGS